MRRLPRNKGMRRFVCVCVCVCVSVCVRMSVNWCMGMQRWKSIPRLDSIYSVPTAFEKLSPNGYCSDWRYPSTGTQSGEYDDESKTAEECMKRCQAKIPGTTAFFLKGTQCGCSACIRMSNFLRNILRCFGTWRRWQYHNLFATHQTI